MQVTCSDCDARYDDALCWTYCPHDRFISDEDAARKDLAYSLLGKFVVLDHKPAGIGPHRVMAVAHNGMVELAGLSGVYFAPRLFTVVDT